MRMRTSCACVALLMTSLALAQQPAKTPVQPAPAKQPDRASAPSPLESLLEAKVKAEWEAFKNKDKKAYSDLLADDFMPSKTTARASATRILRSVKSTAPW